MVRLVIDYLPNFMSKRGEIRVLFHRGWIAISIENIFFIIPSILLFDDSASPLPCG